MFKRYFIPALVVVAVAIPAHAQRGQNPKSNLPAKSTPAFLALFKPTAEKAGKSTVRVLVDGKDAAFGAVVSNDGYILTKASEVHTGRVSVKTGDGRDFDAKVTNSSETYDLAVLKVDGTGLVPIEWSALWPAPAGAGTA